MSNFKESVGLAVGHTGNVVLQWTKENIIGMDQSFSQLFNIVFT